MKTKIINGVGKMFEKALSDVYTKFKINFYRNIFQRFEQREASLTAVETVCVEVIHALGQPTIGQFSSFVMISQANAAYKVQSLIKKGYVEKIQSKFDRREYRLMVTEKFHQYYGVSQNYLQEVSDRINSCFSIEEIQVFTKMLAIINNELMPEVSLNKYEG